MAAAEVLKITHGIGSKVEGMDSRMKGVDGRVQEVGDRVNGLDDKMDQASCSSSLTSSILRPKHPDHREPAARQSPTMAFSSRPIHKLQHCNRCPSHRNSTVVLSRQYLQILAFHRFILVDSWKSYVPLGWLQPFLLIAPHKFGAGSGKTIFWSVHYPHPHLFSPD